MWVLSHQNERLSLFDQKTGQLWAHIALSGNVARALLCWKLTSAAPWSDLSGSAQSSANSAGFPSKWVRQRGAWKQHKCLTAAATRGCETLSLQRGPGVFWPSALSNRRRPEGGSQHVGKTVRTSFLQSCWKPGLSVARKRSFSQVVFQTMSQVSAELGVFASGRCKTEGQTLENIFRLFATWSALRAEGSALCLIEVGKMHPFTLYRWLSLCPCGDPRKVCRLSLSWNLY